MKSITTCRNIERLRFIAAFVLIAAGARSETLTNAVESTNAAWIAPGTLAYHLATNATARASGISPSYESMTEVSRWGYAIFSGTNLASLTNAVWSTNFWLRGVRGLSATTIGLSNGMGGQGLFTMVSPRHYLCASHMHPEGYLAAFLDTNNVICWRKTLQRLDLANDTSVGILNEDLPASVGYLPVLPTNFSQYLPGSDASPVQGIGMNQDLRVFGEPMTFQNPAFVLWNNAASAPLGLPLNWNVAIRGGDSSDPAMLLISNQLVLASHNYFAGGGPNYAAQSAAINQGMHYLSTNNHAATDYQLTPVSLTNWSITRPLR
jgi:hypothetical protein